MKRIAAGMPERGLNLMLTMIAGVFVILALLYAHYIVSTGLYRKDTGVAAALLGIGLVSIVLLIRGTVPWKNRFLYLIYLLLICELLLQLAGFAGAIPKVHTYRHVPYGRVYYTREGFANDMMNRFGWHAPPFTDSSNGQQIALIGDSFVEAVQVPAEETTGPKLEARLAESSSPEAAPAVLAIGLSNIGPAHYLELLKYAHRMFHPQAAVIVLFVGNDFRNLVLARQGRDPSRYIYYELDSGGALRLHPDSAPAVKAFVGRLEYNHRHPIALLPLILRSHYLSPHVLRVTRRAIKRVLGIDRSDSRRRRRGGNGLGTEFADMGLDGFIFKLPLSEEAMAAYEVGLALLDECHRFATANSIALRLVSIPVFPPPFYENNPSVGWSMQLGDYDLRCPDERLKAFAADRQIPFVSLADLMMERNMPIEEIRKLYFGGIGHLTPSGHEFLAQAIASYFHLAPAAAGSESTLVDGDDTGGE